VNAEEDAEYTARVIRAMGGIPPAEAKQLRADLDAARARIAEVERERDLAITHDRQPYPTAEAYDKACAALWKHKADLDAARKLLEAWDQWAANVDTNRPPGVLIMATTLLLVQKRGG
jgi:hypothetical protein